MLHGRYGLQQVGKVLTCLQAPPATFYGAIEGINDFVPTAGMSVMAKINGKSCGAGQTREFEGQLVYVIDVSPDDGGRFAGCGVPGALIAFEVDDRSLATRAVWNNSELWSLPLTTQPMNHISYLPLVISAD